MIKVKPIRIAKKIQDAISYSGFTRILVKFSILLIPVFPKGVLVSDISIITGQSPIIIRTHQNFHALRIGGLTTVPRLMPQLSKEFLDILIGSHFRLDASLGLLDGLVLVLQIATDLKVIVELFVFQGCIITG